MIAMLAWCLAATTAVGLVVLASTRRRRRMRRQTAPTFVFADLAGYTALTEVRGDEAAARLAREFRRSMCAPSREFGATQVKSMGDGVMIWAPDPADAIALAARAVEDVGTRPDLLPCAWAFTPGRPSCAAATGTAARSTWRLAWRPRPIRTRRW